uniref:Ig-like domain-containing protein n=1 Tax=Ursus maritimus TaxID=29073 RepID=A0A452T9S0_URSMA
HCRSLCHQTHRAGALLSLRLRSSCICLEIHRPALCLKDSGWLRAKSWEFVQGALRGNQRYHRGQCSPVVCTAELPKPIITSNNSDPLENADPVVLTCEPQTQSTSYLWSVNRKSLPVSARLQLSLDNRTLTIHRVTRNDTGPYECGTQNPVSAGRSDPFTLNVLYGLDAPTISPSDSYYHPGTSLMLSCHAASNPPARYSWLVNGRPQTSTQELFIPNVTVNDSGAYTCVASNSGTRLSKTTVKTITVSDGRSTTGLPVGSIIGIAVGVLVALALTVALGCLLLRTRTGRYDGISHTLILSCSRPLARRRPHTDQGFWTGYSRPPNYPLEFPVSFPLAPSSAAVDRGASFTCSLVIH